MGHISPPYVRKRVYFTLLICYLHYFLYHIIPVYYLLFYRTNAISFRALVGSLLTTLDCLSRSQLQRGLWSGAETLNTEASWSGRLLLGSLEDSAPVFILCSDVRILVPLLLLFCNHSFVPKWCNICVNIMSRCDSDVLLEMTTGMY